MRGKTALTIIGTALLFLLFNSISFASQYSISCTPSVSSNVFSQSQSCMITNNDNASRWVNVSIAFEKQIQELTSFEHFELVEKTRSYELWDRVNNTLYCGIAVNFTNGFGICQDNVNGTENWSHYYETSTEKSITYSSQVFIGSGNVSVNVTEWLAFNGTSGFLFVPALQNKTTKTNYITYSDTGSWNMTIENDSVLMGFLSSPDWTANYTYFKDVTVTNANWTVGLPVNFTFEISTDTASLISAGKMKPNCSDLKMSYNITASIRVEIPSYTTGCNAANTKTYARLRTLIMPSSSSSVNDSFDAGYRLHYGNINATPSTYNETQVRGLSMDSSVITLLHFDNDSTYGNISAEGNLKNWKNYSPTGVPFKFNVTDKVFGVSSGQWGTRGAEGGATGEVVSLDNMSYDVGLGSSSWTVEMYIMFWNTYDHSMLLDSHGGGNGFYIIKLDNNRQISVYSFSAGLDVASMDFPNENNTWYHLMIVYNSSNTTVQYYMNGTDIGGGQLQINPLTEVGTGAHIGSYYSYSYNFEHNGLMDDWRWSLKARTPVESGWAFPKPVLTLGSEQGGNIASFVNAPVLVDDSAAGGVQVFPVENSAKNIIGNVTIIDTNGFADVSDVVVYIKNSSGSVMQSADIGAYCTNSSNLLNCTNVVFGTFDYYGAPADYSVNVTATDKQNAKGSNSTIFTYTKLASAGIATTITYGYGLPNTVLSILQNVTNWGNVVIWLNVTGANLVNGANTIYASNASIDFYPDLNNSLALKTTAQDFKQDINVNSYITVKHSLSVPAVKAGTYTGTFLIGARERD